MADALKAEGNKLFAEKKFTEAIEKFTEAIELDPGNHVLYSNRSGAYASLKDFSSALQDATKVTDMKPSWAKGWTRKAAALHGEGDLEGASDAYEQALELEPGNAQAKSGMESVRRASDAAVPGGAAGGGGGLGGIGSMFSDPQVYQKLAANPKTSAFLADPVFRAKLERIQKDPNSIATEMMDRGDPRIMTAMGVILGIDVDFASAGAGDAAGSFGAGDAEEDVSMPDPRPAGSDRAQTTAQPSASARSPPQPEPEDDEAKAKREAKQRAEEEKKLGAESYKKRDFDAAVEHFANAWDTHKDITYMNNVGAAKFEKGDYEGAIKACEESVEYGREVLADFKLIAKAFGRIGSAYEKLGDLPNAVLNYQKSLTEHRTPDMLAKFRAAEKAKVQAEKQSYISPEEAEKARELGNKNFKEANWPAAVEAYSEMIKRAPDDARGYSNRAACFIKLLGFPSAVQDCDEAIKHDPKFVRAYLRKAQAYQAMREYSRCLDVLEEATQHDEEGKNVNEIEQMQHKAMQAQYSSREGETEEETMERIQRDPDILGILQDPVMQSILQQAKREPAALQEHMRNPAVKSKIFRLINAGVIRLGR